MRTLLASFAILSLAACSSEQPSIAITDPVVAVTPIGGAGYFTITNAGGPDRLVRAEVPAMGPAMIHETSMDGGIMRMRHIDAVDIPANGTVRFERGGKHVMIGAGAAPLTPGGTTEMRLTFEKAGVVKADARVEGAGESSQGHAR